jgi:predicted dehydrogenase
MHLGYPAVQASYLLLKEIAILIRGVKIMSRFDRRAFLEQCGIGATGLALAGYARTAQGFAANDMLNIGCIGTGVRCQQLMKAIAKIAGTRIAAVCDVWDVHLEKGKSLADPEAFSTKDFRELLARKDIDAVIIGASDHWHTPMTIEACAAGKDVYVEKPVTHDIAEGAGLIEAQNKHGRIVQVGTQQRSMPQFQKAHEIVKAGGIGDIHKVRLVWNRNNARWARNKLGVDPTTVDWKQFLGNAKDQPFDEYRFRNWRWFWDFGGGIFTDLMVHHLDIAHWFLDLDKPTKVTAIGNQYAAKDLWETPDTVQCLFDYGDKQVQVHFEGTFVNARHGGMLEFMGTDATLYLDRGRYEIIPERNKKVVASELVLGTGPRGADYYDLPDGEVLHLTNWVECIRSRKRPNAPAEAGVSAAAAAHLANRAVREQKIIET